MQYVIILSIWLNLVLTFYLFNDTKYYIEVIKDLQEKYLKALEDKIK